MGGGGNVPLWIAPSAPQAPERNFVVDSQPRPQVAAPGVAVAYVVPGVATGDLSLLLLPGAALPPPPGN